MTTSTLSTESYLAFCSASSWISIDRKSISLRLISNYRNNGQIDFHRVGAGTEYPIRRTLARLVADTFHIHLLYRLNRCSGVLE
ncbi:hypothetical protein M6B38_396140 [Iris pallida]|uniref:Uncharacterized protein n=1 Tax=Iris pallida TaxID=29817 RepID=A0AAX6FW98_IRIPA|nr:hypothetical protein M6B38_396140 [Iris pallida]